MAHRASEPLTAQTFLGFAPGSARTSGIGSLYNHYIGILWHFGPPLAWQGGRAHLANPPLTHTRRPRGCLWVSRHDLPPSDPHPLLLQLCRRRPRRDDAPEKGDAGEAEASAPKAAAPPAAAPAPAASTGKGPAANKQVRCPFSPSGQLFFCPPLAIALDPCPPPSVVTAAAVRLHGPPAQAGEGGCDRPDPPHQV